MILLLDTHVLLWWRLDSRKIGPAARRAISRADLVWVSAASAWEVAIKRHLGKLDMDESFAGLVESSEFAELPVRFAHAERVSQLPPHHSDPFDRMLVAQAQVEGATLVTHDRQMASYGVPFLWI